MLTITVIKTLNKIKQSTFITCTNNKIKIFIKCINILRFVPRQHYLQFWGIAIIKKSYSFYLFLQLHFIFGTI